MPAQKPQRPAPGMPLILPRVTDFDSTQRAFDQIGNVVRQVQALLASLRNDVDSILSIAQAGSSSSAIVFDAFLDPAQIVGTVNDWNAGTLGNVTLIRVTSDASRNVNGLVGGVDGKIVALLNVNATGANAPTYNHENVGATDLNRFHNGGGGAKTGGSSGCVWYLYRGAGSSARWWNLMDTQ